MTASFQLAVALDMAGWHAQAWRELEDPAEVFDARFWLRQVQAAEEAGLTFVTIEDSLRTQSTSLWRADDRTDQVRGRLDAVLLAARIAPATSSIGIIPVATTTHTEPFHVSKAIATLDFVTEGRAGVQVRVSSTPLEAAQFGRRHIAETAEQRDLDRHDVAADLFDEAADFVEVLRRLWDSWEEDAEIRDVATGRFVDREKLHYIDFRGRWFSVRGPSISPRPPQGQPVVAALAHVGGAFELAARQADLVFITPRATEDLPHLLDTVRRHEEAVERPGAPLRVMADLVVFLDAHSVRASVRKRALDELDGRPIRSDAAIFVGSTAELLDRLDLWASAGVDGVRLRPGTLHDLEVIADEVAPDVSQAARQNGAGTARQTLRARLGLPAPDNRYVAA